MHTVMNAANNLPGYDGMWFGEGSSDVPSWSGFSSWTKLSEPMIVVTAQLTDWHEKSARQAIELTEYFLDNYAADPSRVYAAGYSAGGETMSQAVSMRPDLYAAYLHGASQWDGRYAPIAENGVAVYIFMVAVMYLAVCTVKYLVPGDPDCGEFCGRLGGFRL